MNNLITITLVGISFAPFLFQKLDIWHAQGLWSQIMILLVFAFTFFEKPERNIINKDIGFLHIWLGGVTLFSAYQFLLLGKYAGIFFYPYFNFLCATILCVACMNYSTRESIERTLKWIEHVITVTMFVCVLQEFGLSQFFNLLTDDMWHNNLVTGFIGNGTHLSGFLASCLPLYLWKKKYLHVALMFLLLLKTSTTVGDPAASGYVVFFAIMAYWFRKSWVFWGTAVLCGVVSMNFLPENFLHPQGRFGIWGYYWNIIKSSPITGVGLGGVRFLAPKTPYPSAMHLHSEALQILFEAGLIGLLLFSNLFFNFFKKRAKNKLDMTLKAMVLGFVVSSFFTYPGHLWLPSMFCVSFYGFFMAQQSSTMLTSDEYKEYFKE